MHCDARHARRMALSIVTKAVEHFSRHTESEEEERNDVKILKHFAGQKIVKS